MLHLIAIRRRLLRSAASLGPAFAYQDNAEISTDGERGDVPGWVLVTLMTAGLVTLLWQTAKPLLTEMFTNAMHAVSGSIG